MVNSQNPRINPEYHFCDFHLKNDNLGLKILKFLGIQTKNRPGLEEKPRSNMSLTLFETRPNDMF